MILKNLVQVPFLIIFFIFSLSPLNIENWCQRWFLFPPNTYSRGSFLSSWGNRIIRATINIFNNAFGGLKFTYMCIHTVYIHTHMQVYEYKATEIPLSCYLPQSTLHVNMDMYTYPLIHLNAHQRHTAVHPKSRFCTECRWYLLQITEFSKTSVLLFSKVLRTWAGYTSDFLYVQFNISFLKLWFLRIVIEIYALFFWVLHRCGDSHGSCSKDPLAYVDSHVSIAIE